MVEDAFSFPWGLARALLPPLERSLPSQRDRLRLTLLTATLFDTESPTCGHTLLALIKANSSSNGTGNSVQLVFPLVSGLDSKQRTVLRDALN